MDINQAWGKTCAILLGEEIGELRQYENYLKKYTATVSRKISKLSGKEVFAGEPRYCQSASFISFDEAEKYQLASKPLDINDIKDLDSIVSAISENIFYGASTVLGNSNFVERSCDVFDSTHVSDSWLIRDASKYMAYCSTVRGSECCFGAVDGGFCKFLIKGYNPYKNERCLEALRSKPISDCYYVANLQGCTDCMFSFNLRNASRAVGNLTLGRDEYVKIKAKLVEDIRTTLEGKKELPTIIDIIRNAAQEKKTERNSGKRSATKHQATPDFVEKTFQTITNVVLGTPLGQPDSYQDYMEEYGVKLEKFKSVFSDELVAVPEVAYYQPIAGCFAKMDEALALGKRSITLEQAHSLKLGNSPSTLAAIAVSCPEIEYGSNLNMVDCCDVQDSNNSYKGSLVFMSKYAYFSFFLRDCESAIGCGALLRSRFAIRCRNSVNLNRCFEVSDSNSCTDCYFCQNCENVNDSMFCFNAKNLRYAIANREIGREKYLEIKRRILAEIAGTLKKSHRLELSIYNLGCKVKS